MIALGVPQIVALLVALQRLAELVHSRRNTRRLLREGGKEHGRSHYRVMVALHAAWLIAIATAIPAEAPTDWGLLGLFVLLQPLRLWVILTLGKFWTTRLIAVPHAQLVRSGPYRWMRHPNYAIVVLEIALLPLAFGAWELALVFSAANLAVLGYRVRMEERLLGRRSPAV